MKICVNTFKDDVIVFINNVIMCLTSYIYTIVNLFCENRFLRAIHKTGGCLINMKCTLKGNKNLGHIIQDIA
jgi:hypothetical protein